MELPFELQQNIVEFLVSVPNIQSRNAQQALIFSAGLDSQLQSKIGFPESVDQFAKLLVSALLNYGTLNDGRYALNAVLEAAKDSVGQDRKAYCDTLIEELRKIQQPGVDEAKIAGMKHTARRLEQNQAYQEAIKAWQEIREFGQEQAEAEHEVERLEQKQAHSESLQKILQQLSLRIKELQENYLPVARRLKRLQKEGIDEEGELLLEIVDQFLTKTLSVEEFSQIWQSALIVPDKKEEVNYKALAQRLTRGEIIPVLGPELHHLCGLPLPSSEQLVQALAAEARYDDFEGPLSMISQYYEMTEYGRGTLLQNVRNVLEPEAELPESYPLYHFLAKLPEPVLVISACYDRLLERYFTDSGKKFVIISHLRLDEHLGKILLKYSDRAEPEEPCRAESISPLKPFEKGYSILYKMCGCFGTSPAETGGAMDSVMISEKDYFSFARQIEKIIPEYLATQIGRKVLLFLGSALKDWQDRLILNAILEKNRGNQARSYAVQEDPGKYEIEYWKFQGVDLYQREVRAGGHKLGEHREGGLERL